MKEEPTLQSLRAAGAHQRDPVRFHYLEALERKLHTQPAAVQRVLACKLHDAIRAFEHTPPAAPRPSSTARQPPATSRLAEFNRELAALAPSGSPLTPAPGQGSPIELRSVRQFSTVWKKIAADTAVRHTLSTGPDNAGPLNPHRLMLRSLNLMRTLSPDYLRHFWSHMDSLLWLEQMHASTASPAAKPTAKSTTKPTTKPVRKARAN